MTFLYSWLIDPRYGAGLALLLKVSALLALTGLVAGRVSRFQAARRHFIWALGLIAALLLLPLSSVSPTWVIELGSAPVSALRSPVASAATHPPAANSRVHTEGSPIPLAERASAAARGFDVRRLLLVAWLGGTAAFLAYTLLGHVGLRLIARRGPFTTEAAWEKRVRTAAQRLGMTSVPRVHLSDAVTIPLTFGFVRPVVLLPSAAHGWTEARKHVVLLHELAHIARRDALTQLFAALTCAVYWFHPLVWLGAARMRVERERACDDLVVASGTEPAEYASHLLDIATTARPMPASSFAALAMARPSQFEGRLLAILDRRRSIKPARSRSFPAVLALICVACIATPVAALRIVPRADAARHEQTPRASIVQPSGRIQLSRVDNGGVFQTGSGDIYIGTAVGPLELQTGDGHIRVESLRGALNARTARGDVTVMAFDETVPFTDAIKIVAERGNVTLLLPEHFSGELDVETQARLNERPTTILSDFPIDIRTSVTRAGNEEFEVRAARATIGGGTAKVTIRARSGNVVVRRTNAPQ